MKSNEEHKQHILPEVLEEADDMDHSQHGKHHDYMEHESKTEIKRKGPSNSTATRACSGHIPGDALLSHKVTLAVPSALEVLTSVFGMGTGVAPPLWPPGNALMQSRSSLTSIQGSGNPNGFHRGI